jgi:hypothetical protein
MHDILQDNLEANAAGLTKAEGVPAASVFDFDATSRTFSAADFPLVADFPEELQFRIAVVGNVIDKIAQDGDTLLCVRASAEGAEPQDGDLVVIDIGDREASRVEIRRMRRIGDVCEFRHESNDPEFQAAPLIYDMRQEEGRVRILGKVLLACRRLGA